MLPLPVPSVKSLIEAEARSLYHGIEGATLKGNGIGARAWLVLILTTINTMHDARQAAPHGAPTEAQQAAINHLLADCMDFVSSSKAMTPADPLEVLGSKAQSYWGEPVYVAQPIAIKQVEPTLPKEDVAGSVDICIVLFG